MNIQLKQNSDEIIAGMKNLNKKFSGKKILLTGAAGFLGCQFSHYFIALNNSGILKNPCHLYAWDNYLRGVPDWMNNLADDPKLDDIFQLSADCVDQIANGDEVENSNAYKKGELISFFETMNNMQFQKVQTFFESMPKVSHTIEVFNPKTEKKSEMVLEGMASFFA